VKDKVNTPGDQCGIQPNLILRKEDCSVWSGLICLRPTTGSFECDNESWSSVRCWRCLH